MKMFKSLNKGLLLAGTSSILALVYSANAQNRLSTSTNAQAIQPNVEFQSPIASPTVASGLPFQITVDGVAIDGSLATAQDDQRTLDVALDRMDVQMTFDGLKLDKSLNITADKGAYAAGELVSMRGYWNYSAFIESAEVRIFAADASTDGTPLVVLDLDQQRKLAWEYPNGMPGEVQFVLRVYGNNGNFDETAPKLLTTVAQPVDAAGGDNGPDVETLAGYDENALLKSGIVVTGGTVTVFGTEVPANNNVYVLGNPVPVDPSGRFVAAEILPSGDHNVDIAVLDSQGRGLEFQRNLYIPGSDLFYVGLGDFTVGTGAVSGPTELVGENSEWGENITTQARVAAFVRGKVADNIFVTAQADTGEGSLNPDRDDFIFSNFLSRDPSKLVDRVETFETYNTFGDDSKIERIVNSQGKFYVKAEQGQSHALWGNFSTNINGPVFAAVNRSLYGANLSYRSEALQTPNGQPMIEVDAFGALQGTMGHRDVMRGTGGSVYFLTYQDIARGGERVAIEIRDQFTGEVVSKKELVYGEDYDIDSIQGRIILIDALPSSASDGYLVSDGLANSGDAVFLVVDYEYTPNDGEALNDLFYGGRVVGRLGDWVTVGGTYLRDENTAPGTEARQLIGGDVALSMGGASYIRGEVAQTVGDPTAEFGSDDGGYSVGDNNASASGVDHSEPALAYRVDALIDTRDFMDFSARLSGYYEHKDAGAAVANGYAAQEKNAFGVAAKVPIADIVTLGARYDNVTTAPDTVDESNVQRANLDANANFGPFSAGLGVGFNDTDGVTTTNIGGQVGFKASELLQLGVNASTTIASSNPDAGSTNFGGSITSQITDRLSVSANAGYSLPRDGSEGSWKANVTSNYNLDDRTQMSLGYGLNDRTGNFFGSNALSGDLNFGFRRKFTDSLNFYIEERLAHTGDSIDGLTHMFGVDYAPAEAWQASINAELGTVSNLERRAVSANAGYRGDGFNVGIAGEYRWEQNLAETSFDDIRQTYVGKANASVNISEDWRAQANANVVLSERNGSFVDGNFIEGTVGAAYRPVDNNTFNGLFRYTFLYDLPTDTNVDVTLGANGVIGSATQYKQRSHIIEADGIWQINDNFSLGAKYGVRFGEVTTSRSSDDWYGDTIHLGIARVDWHVVHNWDALLEGRVMYQQDTGATRFGAVAALYRHIGDNFKVGVGYNFGSFNDDLTDVSFDSQGLFLNAIAKF